MAANISSVAGGTQEPPRDEARERRLAWFREAKFGMFVHWGLYAIPAGIWKGKEVPGLGEWIMFRARIPVKEYAQLAKQFNPTRFNANEWVQIARSAGMRYFVITAKHHDGFAMYDSRVTDYDIVDATPFGRDPMKELAEACRREGLRFCFYYSHVQDWHHPDAVGNDWDYDPAKKDFNRYMREKALPQVRELLTQYGPLGLIWFDTPRNIALEQAEAFRALVRSLQPDCLINGRIGHGLGDYREMGDNRIPEDVVEEDWEVPATINNTWGYKVTDHNWKPVERLLFNLVDIVSKGGNYLLNVGPTAEGVIPEPSVERLLAMGRWLSVNGEAIYGAGRSPFRPVSKFPWRCTTKPGRLYFTLFQWSETLEIPALQHRVVRASLLADPDRTLSVKQRPDSVVVTLPPHPPDPIASVVVVEIDSAASPPAKD